MDEHRKRSDTPHVLNVVQLVAVNFVCLVGLVVTLRIENISWGVSIVLAWIGAALITCATMVVYAFLQGRRSDRVVARQTAKLSGPKLVDPSITENSHWSSRLETTRAVPDGRTL